MMKFKGITREEKGCKKGLYFGRGSASREPTKETAYIYC